MKRYLQLHIVTLRHLQQKMNIHIVKVMAKVALLEEAHSGISLSLEYATDKSCLRLNKSKQTTDAPN